MSSRGDANGDESKRRHDRSRDKHGHKHKRHKHKHKKRDGDGVHRPLTDPAISDKLLSDAVFVKQLPPCYPTNAFPPEMYEVVNLDETDFSSIHEAKALFLSIALGEQKFKVDNEKMRLGYAVLPKVETPDGSRGNIPMSRPTRREVPIENGLAAKQLAECEERLRLKQETDDRRGHHRRHSPSSRRRDKDHGSRRRHHGGGGGGGEDSYSSSDDGRLPAPRDTKRPPSDYGGDDDERRTHRRREGDALRRMDMVTMLAKSDRYDLGSSLGDKESGGSSGEGGGGDDDAGRRAHREGNAAFDRFSTSLGGSGGAAGASSSSSPHHHHHHSTQHADAHDAITTLSKPDIYDEASRRRAILEYQKSVNDCIDAAIPVPIKLPYDQLALASFEYIKIATADNQAALIKAETVESYGKRVSGLMKMVVGINTATGRQLKFTPDESPEGTKQLMARLDGLVRKHRGDLSRFYDDQLRRVGSPSRMLWPPALAIGADIVKTFVGLHVKNELGLDLDSSDLAQTSAMNVATKGSDVTYYDPPSYTYTGQPPPPSPPPPPASSPHPQQQPAYTQQPPQQQHHGYTHSPAPGPHQPAQFQHENGVPTPTQQPSTSTQYYPNTSAPSGAAAAPPPAPGASHSGSSAPSGESAHHHQQQQHMSKHDFMVQMSHEEVASMKRARSAMMKR